MAFRSRSAPRPMQRGLGRWVPVAAAAAVLAAVAGCGDGGSGDASSDRSSTSAVPAAAGPYFGVCGSLTDDEVRAEFAVPSFATVTRNSVGCEWEVSGPTGPSVSFSWYRGSPIGRERAGSELIGRPAEDIEIAGKNGFLARQEDPFGVTFICEIGLQYDADFAHFSVTYSDSQPTADPCRVATNLMTTVAERAQ